MCVWVLSPHSSDKTASKADTAIIMKIAKREVRVKSPILEEVIPPTPIWTNLKAAAADPAFLEKGARDRADELGSVSPIQDRYKNIPTTVPKSPTKPL